MSTQFAKSFCVFYITMYYLIKGNDLQIIIIAFISLKFLLSAVR
jgi:hypothetical protein